MTPVGKAEASFGGEKAAASRRSPKHSQEWLCHKEDAGLKAGPYKGRKRAKRDSSLRKGIRSAKRALRSE
jgi:hypothetical protein